MSFISNMDLNVLFFLNFAQMGGWKCHFWPQLRYSGHDSIIYIYDAIQTHTKWQLRFADLHGPVAGGWVENVPYRPPYGQPWCNTETILTEYTETCDTTELAPPPGIYYITSCERMQQVLRRVRRVLRKSRGIQPVLVKWNLVFCLVFSVSSRVCVFKSSSELGRWWRAQPSFKAEFCQCLGLVWKWSCSAVCCGCRLVQIRSSCVWPLCVTHHVQRCSSLSVHPVNSVRKHTRFLTVERLQAETGAWAPFFLLYINDIHPMSNPRLHYGGLVGQKEFTKHDSVFRKPCIFSQTQYKKNTQQNFTNTVRSYKKYQIYQNTFRKPLQDFF